MVLGLQDHPSITLYDAFLGFVTSFIAVIHNLVGFNAVSKGASGPNSTLF